MNKFIRFWTSFHNHVEGYILGEGKRDLMTPHIPLYYPTKPYMYLKKILKRRKKIKGFQGKLNNRRESLPRSKSEMVLGRKEKGKVEECVKL